jgi:putative nucleotidyltransferase-like protein
VNDWIVRRQETSNCVGNAADAALETLHSARARVALIVMGRTVPNLPDSPTQREMTIARKNSVGLEYADHFPTAAAILAVENDRLTGFLDALEETSESFQAAKIPHILIKHRRRYRYYDSNVDVVVSHDDWNRAIELLHSRGYAGNVMFKEPDKIMFDHPAKRISVHLHPGVTWNGVPYISTEFLWSNAQPQGNGFRRELSDEFEFLVSVGHLLFENYEITLGDLLSFSRDLQTGTIDIARLSGIARANRWEWGFRQVFEQVTTLVENWNTTTDAAAVPGHLLSFPYQIPPAVLARTYSRRIVSNAHDGHWRRALREIYAYPAFYALKRRHDLPWIRRS